MQNVTCVELRVAAKAIDDEAFSQLMATFGALGGSEEIEMPSAETVRIAWFDIADNQEEQYLRLKTAALLLGATDEQVSIATLNDDWETAWQKNWTAIPVGQSLCIRPSFCEALPDRKVDVVLDPGMAFGTGTHPTTFLCLEAVENYCLTQTPQSVLDMGAGSGLLAIAAGKMGVQDIHAIDYDPLSVEASQVNARINNVNLTAILDDSPPQRQFELVVANILAGPLLDMAQALSACVANHLILSGLLTTQVDNMISTYTNHGLRHKVTHTKEDWAAIEFVR